MLLPATVVANSAAPPVLQLGEASTRVEMLDEVIVTGSHIRGDASAGSFVLVLDRSEPLELSSEVALAFWIPFGSLAQKESWQQDTVSARGVQINARVFRHDDHVIWGMTERILAQLLDLL